MIRIEHLTLPGGLSAIARKGASGELVLVVSTALPSDQRREAIRVALRAARRHEWQLGLVPLPVVAALSWLRRSLRPFGHVVRAHAVASAVTSTAVTAAAAIAALVLVAAPPSNPHLSAVGPAAPSQLKSGGTTTEPHGGRQGQQRAALTPSHPGRTKPGVVTVAKPGTSPRPAPSTSTGTPSPKPEPEPSSAPTTAQPSPAPAPSASQSSGGGDCIHVLGLVICV